MTSVVIVNCCLTIEGRIRSLKIMMYHVPSAVEPGKEKFASTVRWTDRLCPPPPPPPPPLGSSFISCTTLGVPTRVTLIAEFPWVVTPGACLGKLCLVHISCESYKRLKVHFCHFHSSQNE